MQLNTLQCTGELPLPSPTKNDLAQNISGAEVEKPGLTNYIGPISLLITGWQLG